MGDFDFPKIIRASRISLTCLILLFITWYFQITEGAWALITIWFVMFEYSTLGGVFQKSLYRFLGTILSAIYGMIIIYLFHNNFFINIIAFVIGVFIYSFFFMKGERGYIGTIGGVTLTIVLFNYNHIDIAIVRVFNIVLGIFVAIFTMRFFFPIYARDEIIKKQKFIIDFFIEILDQCLDPTIDALMLKKYFNKHELEIRDKLALFHVDIQEAKWETRNIPQFVVDVDLAVEHTKRFFQLLSVFISNFLTNEIMEDFAIQTKIKEFIHICDEMKLFFAGELQQTAKKTISLPTQNIIINGLENELMAIRQALKIELELSTQ